MDQAVSTTDERQDSELMLAYAANERGAFERLYARHKQSLTGYFFASTRDEAISVELFQETWMRVIKQRTSYVATARFSTWLYTIAHHCLVDHFRRSAVRSGETEFDESTVELDPVNDIPLRPDELAELQQQGDLLNQVLAKLPSAQSEALLLRHVAGMSLGEIASLTGAKDETVKSRIRYAVKFLRAELRVSA